MRKYKKNNNFFRTCVAIALTLLIVASFAQGLFKDFQNSNGIEIVEQQVSIQQVSSNGGSTFTWFDEFMDSSKIDGALSSNYILSNGSIVMKNTYECWDVYADWQRMKPIIVTNSGSETIENYVIELTIAYDSDMQLNFNDVRFTDETGTPLTYFIVDVENGVSAQMLVRIPLIPAFETTTLYMFYANPSVGNESDNTIFTWNRLTSGEDTRLSWTWQTQGAWDPGVSYGGGKFIVAWEEGIGPAYSSNQNHRLNPRQIRLRLLDTDGGNPIPEYPSAINISTAGTTNYHAENPKIAYSPSSDKFLVVWDENPTLYKWGVGIKGALITPSGFNYWPFTIATPLYSGLQYYPCYDPCVAYDEFSNRFFVVWSQSDTSWNYNVYGKFYGPNGGQIGSQVTIASGSLSQVQPWVCSDNQGNFMVVYEEGNHPSTGPFSLKAKIFDYTGVQVGSTIHIATGTSSTDNLFPHVSFNEVSNKYLVTWNTGKASNNNFNGLIYGMLINQNGVPEGSFIIQSGTMYKVATSVPYLGSRFFVSYDSGFWDLNHIWGQLVNSDGIKVSNRPQLSENLPFNKEWARSVAGEGNIFVAWEDDRLDFNTPPTEIRGSIWTCPQSTESSDISYSYGNEITRVLQAAVVSVVIEPEDFIEWINFSVSATYVSGATLKFNILDENATIILLEDISSGEDLSLIENASIRLQALFSRPKPTVTPVLDSWSVKALIGSDIQPPWTEIFMDPVAPDGQNGWYISPIEIGFVAYDNDTSPENVTTYYRINAGSVLEYEPGSIIVLSTEGANNSIEYWSIDSAGNEELPHNLIGNISIDLTAPFVTLYGLEDIVSPGIVSINGSATEYLSGSGIDRILIRINGELAVTVNGSGENSVDFLWEFTAEIGEVYTIAVEVYDIAGNYIVERKTVTCSERGIYEIGYIYLFDNPKIGPIELLRSLELAAAVQYEGLYVLCSDVHPNASTVKFVAKQQFMEYEFYVWDTNLSDGCSAVLNLPMLGLYEISAHVYDEDNVLLQQIQIIKRMAVLIL
ncbi:MAG: DUF2341 domain-containing protein [Thermoplasmatota archaeon]